MCTEYHSRSRRHGAVFARRRGRAHVSAVPRELRRGARARAARARCRACARSSRHAASICSSADCSSRLPRRPVRLPVRLPVHDANASSAGHAACTASRHAVPVLVRTTRPRGCYCYCWRRCCNAARTASRADTIPVPESAEEWHGSVHGRRRCTNGRRYNTSCSTRRHQSIRTACATDHAKPQCT